MNPTPLSAALEHYVQLARTPGWKEHCWHMVKQMAADDPQFASLPRLLTEAMRGKAPVRPPAKDAG